METETKILTKTLSFIASHMSSSKLLVLRVGKTFAPNTRRRSSTGALYAGSSASFSSSSSSDSSASSTCAVPCLPSSAVTTIPGTESSLGFDGSCRCEAPSPAPGRPSPVCNDSVDLLNNAWNSLSSWPCLAVEARPELLQAQPAVVFASGNVATNSCRPAMLPR